MLYTGRGSSDQPTASKATWVTRIISSHISINLPRRKSNASNYAVAVANYPKEAGTTRQ